MRHYLLAVHDIKRCQAVNKKTFHDSRGSPDAVRSSRNGTPSISGGLHRCSLINGSFGEI
eukprot:23646-Eustigmatos_ZCMA.PRE.1